MNIVAICTVKNEIDIIEACVRHALAYVNHFVILDNGSTDGTLDVLKALHAEGLPVTLLEDPTIGIYQAERMTMMMKEHAIGRLNADWVLPLDADEFISTTDSESVISETWDCDRPVALPWRNYMPNAQDDQSQRNPVLRMGHRFAEKCETVKVLIPARLAALPDAFLVQGSHRLKIAGKECEVLRQDQVYLGHFPIRSQGQYLAKIVLRILQYLVIPQREAFETYDYRKQFAALKQDVETFSGNYIREAIDNFKVHNETRSDALTFDPMSYRGGELRCTPDWNENSRAWNNILSYAENLAERYGILANYGDPARGTMLEQCHELVENFRARLDGMVVELMAKENVIQRQRWALEEKEICVREQYRQLIEKESCIQDQHRQLLEKETVIHELSRKLQSPTAMRKLRQMLARLRS